MVAVDTLDDCWTRVVDAVRPLDERDFLRPTRADGWCVADLLFHLLLDAQRALVAFATPTPRPADTDRVSYWRPFRPDSGDSGVGHARFVRIAASAYAAPATLVEHYATTSRAALRAAAATSADGRFETQGVVLTAADLVATLVVEASVHHLDLVANLPDAPAASPEGLRLTRQVLDGLLGGRLPEAWPDDVAALKGTGRLALGDEDRRLLSGNADKFPLFG